MQRSDQPIGRPEFSGSEKWRCDRVRRLDLFARIGLQIDVGRLCACMSEPEGHFGHDPIWCPPNRVMSNPESQWKTLRTTNAIERLNGEFRRRVKTQASLPTEDSALILLFSLVASGQVKLRRIDGWKDIRKTASQTDRKSDKAA